MDTKALQDDLRKAIKLLPPEAITKVTDLLNFAFKNMDALKPTFPEIGALLSNHFTAAMFERATGMLNTDEIEDAMREVFMEAGIKPDESLAPGPYSAT